MMPDSCFKFFLSLMLALTVAMPAKAQIAQSTPVSAEGPATPATAAQSLPPEPDDEVTILRDDYAGKYNVSTLANLSKLYWRLGAFDLEDTDALSNYVKINECSLYTEYVNDDLEWREILKTMGKHVQNGKDKFPLNFQFVLPLHLGRYDPALGGFEIVNKTGFKNAKRIEVNSIDKNYKVCHDDSTLKDYPRDVMILLPGPFTLDFVKLDEHVAQAFILRKKSEYAALPEEMRVRRYERDAYLRLRITFSQYHGNLESSRGLPLAILYGKIDGYDIFEDIKQKRLMLSVDLTGQTVQTAPMSMPAAKTPADPATARTAPVRTNTQVSPAPEQPATQQPVTEAPLAPAATP